MKIKTYKVDTVAEAYPMILHDLGNDAIILKTTAVRAEGLLGLFGRKKIEVVAASELGRNTVQHNEPPSVPLVSDRNEAVMKELAEMKKLIHSMSQEKVHNRLEKWMKRLEEQEVDQEVVAYIVKKLELMYTNLEEIHDEQLEAALLSIIEQLVAEGITKEERNDSYVMTLLGPTGVGKTTTIAKLAAIHMLKQRKRVGLLTADTYRIAAVEQLRTYANILNVPLQVISNSSELKPSLQSLQDCQIVFMDSAGRNYLEQANVREINQFLEQGFPQENYLVLSMTTRWRDMQTIVENMKSIPIDKLIVTKWDETNCYGAILNMLYHYPYPLSYIGIGQGVPQDIIDANPTYIAKKILGVDEDARSSTSFERII